MRNLLLFSFATIPLCSAWVLNTAPVGLIAGTCIPSLRSGCLLSVARRASRVPGKGTSQFSANLGGIIGGLTSVLRGGMTSAPTTNTDDPSAPWKDTAPSWDELKSMLEASQTEDERRFRSDLAAGRGNANAMASIRLFDAPDGTEPRVVLYRDYAAWCPYCQKVWIMLEEKKIPYKVEKASPSLKYIHIDCMCLVAAIGECTFAIESSTADSNER